MGLKFSGGKRVCLIFKELIVALKKPIKFSSKKTFFLLSMTSMTVVNHLSLLSINKMTERTWNLVKKNPLH